MEYSQILYETKGPVALITLNRPEKLNAWTPTMCEEQAQAIERANKDKSVGAIIMTGAGRGFCAGADVQDTFQTRIDGEDPGNDTAGGSGGMPAGVDWLEIIRESKPIIAAVKSNGIKFGIRETTTILKELNIQAIKIEINIITRKRLNIRFFIKNFVPFKNTIEMPVITVL